MSKLLIDDYPLLVLPGLACKVGLNESIFLQQLHWLCERSKHEHDGHSWIYNTAEDWQTGTFPFWSTDTIRRIIKSLKAKKVIITTSKYNKMKFDNTTWFRIDYTSSVFATPSMQNAQPVYAECPAPPMQNAEVDVDILPITIPETFHRPSIEINTEEPVSVSQSFELPSWVPEKAWAGFLEMREATGKKVSTDYAKEVLIGELDALRANGHQPELVLNNSIASNWPNLWPTKSFLSGPPASGSQPSGTVPPTPYAPEPVIDPNNPSGLTEAGKQKLAEAAQARVAATAAKSAAATPKHVAQARVGDILKNLGVPKQ